ncbi:MAG: iron ABC transporter permease [Bacteroidota bacterium]
MLRASEAEPAVLRSLLLRERTLRLLVNTLVLTGGVIVLSTALALPMAWLSTRAALPGRRWITLLGVLPLTMPAYVMAYVLLASTGATGTLAQLFGLLTPRISGYWGALIALGLTTFPYLFLNLRAALQGLDPALEETAQSLGLRPTQVFVRIVLPQLRPAYYAGTLLVTLHVLGDFGVVSLMRFETFSYALYVQYSAAYDRIYAAWLALMVLSLTIGALVMEARLLRGLAFHRAGTGAVRPARRVQLGRMAYPAYAFMGLLLVASLILPLITIGYWVGADTAATSWGRLTEAMGRSLMASAPAAGLAGLLALPLAYLGVRYPSIWTRGLERIAYLGYAAPPLAFALAYVFFSLRTVPVLYQTLALLVMVYTLHFMAEALGPVRSALYQASPRLEEAARSLGRSPLQAFFEVTFPLVRRGLLAGSALVFLSAMKELPLTFILSPPGFQTLAVSVWSSTSEAVFSVAAPYALVLILCSAAFVGLLLKDQADPSKRPSQPSKARHRSAREADQDGPSAVAMEHP